MSVAGCLLMLSGAVEFGMNPPYGRGLIQGFIGRLIAEVDAGHVEAALVLTSVHAMSSASSGQLLLKASRGQCVLSGRLSFWGAHSTGASPTFGSVVTALGRGLDVARFNDVWSAHGAVVIDGGR